MWFWILATLVAFYVKGLCGFANTLVFTSIMGFGVDNVNISPVELVVGFPTNVILTWQNRTKLKRSIYLPLTLMVLAGSLPGAFLLRNVDAHIIKIIFGAVVILIGLEMFLREKSQKKYRENKVVLVIVGILAGLMCGLFGVGALLAAYISRVTDNMEEFKANSAFIFIVDNLFRMVTYSVLGVITWESLRLSFLLMPVMLIGLFAGIRSSKVLNEKIVKKLVIVLLVVSGIALIAKNL